MQLEDLPQEWAVCTISDVADVNPKKITADFSLAAGFVPMSHAPTDFKSKLLFEVKPWGEIQKAYTNFQNGDVIFAKVTPCFENGKAAIVDALPNGIGAGSSEFYVLRPNSAAALNRTLFALIKTRTFAQNGAENMTGAVGLRRVPRAFVEDFRFPLPPLAEQKVIADKLDTLLAQVDNTKARLERIPEIIKSFRQSVLAAAVSGKLTEEWRSNTSIESRCYSLIATEERKLRGIRETKHSKIANTEEVPFEIPDSWQWFRLGNLALKITDGAHNTPKVLNEGFPYIMAKDLTVGFLDFSEKRYISEKEHRELYLKCIPERDDLLVVNIGAGTGNNVLVDVDFEFSFKNIAIIKRPSFILGK